MRKCDATKKDRLDETKKLTDDSLLEYYNASYFCVTTNDYLFNTSKSDSAKNSFSNYQRQYKSRIIYVSISEYVALILEVEVQV